MSSMRFLIMGPPGGGKGTLSQRLVKEFGLTHFSSGDALRGHIRDDTDLGKQAKGYMDKGDLVPDELMVDMVLSHVGSVDQKTNKWLLDGFPRNVPQAEALDEQFELDLVINLDIPHEEIVERLRHRMVHPSSGRSYHAIWNPPKVEGKDDETGEDLIVRDDDKPDAVRDRLTVYEQNTRPVLEHYMAKGKAANFHGTESNVIWPVMLQHIKDKYGL
uniref:GTP:AMP phosphotransferase, mitochondrial n=1 Tax=Lotharella globosa TaxID=91324 RepID=A0A7S3Z8N0_9EUKA